MTASLAQDSEKQSASSCLSNRRETDEFGVTSQFLEALS